MCDDGIRIDAGGAEPASLVSEVVVNAAALGAQDVARNIKGLDPAHVPPLHYAKGNYFYLTGKSPFSRLVYPMPSGAWLGGARRARPRQPLPLRPGPALGRYPRLRRGHRPGREILRIDPTLLPGVARRGAAARLHRYPPQDLRRRRAGARFRHPGRGGARHRRAGEPVRDRVPGAHLVARDRRGGLRRASRKPLRVGLVHYRGPDASAGTTDHRRTPRMPAHEIRRQCFARAIEITSPAAAVHGDTRGPARRGCAPAPVRRTRRTPCATPRAAPRTRRARRDGDGRGGSSHGGSD